MSEQPSYKVQAKNLYKIFGKHPEEALQQMRDGASKNDVYRDTGSVVAVENVSFDVRPGEIFVVMGLSGSGKSTLIRCVNRLIEATSGQVLVDDEDILRADPERLRQIRLAKIAMVFQHFALFPHKTVGANVEYGLKIQGVSEEKRRAKALEALDMVGLKEWAGTPPNNLSGGMRQRVGLARALAVDPEILLMDEPFSALDPLIRRDMQGELIGIQQRFRNSIIFITHDLNEALTLGHHIAIMKDGRFVQVGTAENIVAHPADDYVSAFTQDVDRGRVFKAGTVMRDAEAVVLDQTSLETAVARMQARAHAALYVTQHDGKPAGLLVAADLQGAGTKGKHGLAAAMRTQFPQTSAAAMLVDVFELCADGLPVAVIDDDGRLCGVVHPNDVFRVLAGGTAEESTEATQAENAEEQSRAASAAPSAPG